MIICLPFLPKKELPVLVESSDVILKRLNDWLATKGCPAVEVRFFDPAYGMYKMTDVKKVIDWAYQNMYTGRVLGPSAPPELVNPGSNDCDNRAEHYSYWLHRALPGFPVASMSGSKDGKRHRFIVAICLDGIIPKDDMGYWGNINTVII
jgi:hypothetical protein